MAGKPRLHVLFDHGEQNGVVGNVETMEKLDKVFCVGVVQFVEVDGFYLDGVCVLVFAGKHLYLAICLGHQHVVVIVCVIYRHI